MLNMDIDLIEKWVKPFAEENDITTYRNEEGDYIFTRQLLKGLCYHIYSRPSSLKLYRLCELILFKMDAEQAKAKVFHNSLKHYSVTERELTIDIVNGTTVYFIIPVSCADSTKFVVESIIDECINMFIKFTEQSGNSYTIFAKYNYYTGKLIKTSFPEFEGKDSNLSPLDVF
jgi:hypothetical protein